MQRRLWSLDVDLRCRVRWWKPCWSLELKLPLICQLISSKALSDVQWRRWWPELLTAFFASRNVGESTQPTFWGARMFRRGLSLMTLHTRSHRIRADDPSVSNVTTERATLDELPIWTAKSVQPLWMDVERDKGALKCHNCRSGLA
ncbi:hypothetical protein HPB48_001654 [Haemaphysalis longicornis]|uniref:Uncharacterized protein n=1 Tax=Haemaphysalis longicornis TaxID=44386 RepID=A0A9J6GU78_HAELO|nr:hypothetical protein HPB48_001654 [Haemaphysalis longicornis]